jgi:Flp pilus assembly protein TadG
VDCGASAEFEPFHKEDSKMSFRGRSKGQVMTLFALMIPALLGVIGLCTDAAVIYVNWEVMQKAADAAALAGANYLPFDSSSAQKTATTFAENNGIQSKEITGTQVSLDQLSITVKLNRTVPYYFARVVGMSDAAVNVTARAGVQPNGANGRGLIPLGLSCPQGNCSAYIPGLTYSLKQDQSQTSLSGNWGALALGAPGANQYRQNLAFGYTGTIGTSVATETGNIVGPTGQAVAERIAAGVMVDSSILAGLAPLGIAPAYDPRLVVVPMVDFSASGKGGNTTVPIVQFAQMWLLGTSGNNNTVNAVYLGTTTPSQSATVANFGVLTPVLLN